MQSMYVFRRNDNMQLTIYSPEASLLILFGENDYKEEKVRTYDR